MENVETVRDLRFWDDEKKGTFIIPAGTQGFVLTKNHFYTLEDEELRAALFRAKRIYEKREQAGVFVYLERKYRWLNDGDFRRARIRDE